MSFARNVLALRMITLLVITYRLPYRSDILLCWNDKVARFYETLTAKLSFEC